MENEVSCKVVQLVIGMGYRQADAEGPTFHPC